ncbi:hypothetical protein E1A91_A13G102200v1 [Gossypium mustelinum]|uniref:Uncharacterized protein n=1 Tax=Gossypium mustelinum TaxID=34275 RepID=A0A5D2WG86_GOSMU|nr:hypothetical protein E1A91_A13G102200v1 [Gossypium mustelinum]
MHVLTAGYTEGWFGYILLLLCAFFLRTYWYVLPPNYRSDPSDEKLNSALLLSRQTYPPRRFMEFLWIALGEIYQISRSRDRSAPYPRRWFAAENKIASERTFVRFFSTKHESLRITVGRWLPKETPIRSAPRLGGIYLIPITRGERMKCIGDHPFVAACSSDLRIRRGPQALLSMAFPLDFPNVELSDFLTFA